MQENDPIRAAGWAGQIPADQWEVYRRVLEQARGQEIRFALGGAFAVATYTEQWRNTKDLDIYILPEDRGKCIELLSSHGLRDYYDILNYDRSWIYRAHKGETIVDLIFRMANQRAEVDEHWLTRGALVDLRGFICRVIPVEEMVWDKLYVFQRDRCDWPDVMNLLFAAGAWLDWEHLLGRTASHRPLLTAGLTVFRWICPGRARTFPEWIWKHVGLPPPGNGEAPEADFSLIRLLDSRPWFRAGHRHGR